MSQRCSCGFAIRRGISIIQNDARAAFIAFGFGINFFIKQISTERALSAARLLQSPGEEKNETEDTGSACDGKPRVRGVRRFEKQIWNTEELTRNEGSRKHHEKPGDEKVEGEGFDSLFDVGLSEVDRSRLGIWRVE